MALQHKPLHSTLLFSISRLRDSSSPPPPAGEAQAPASTQVEQNQGCARVQYSPTLRQQNSISSKGLNVDFIIQYDVELRDLMGDIQVRPCTQLTLTYSIHATNKHTHAGKHIYTC